MKKPSDTEAINSEGKVVKFSSTQASTPSTTNKTKTKTVTPMSTVKSPHKKRGVVVDNEFDLVVDKQIMMTSATVELRKGQVKVLKAFNEHLCSMESFHNLDDERIHTMITDWLDTRSNIRKHVLTDIERKKLLKKPYAFQPDDILEYGDFHFGHKHFSYHTYVDKLKKEYEQKNPRRSQYKAEKKPFLRMPDLTICGNSMCSGCGKVGLYCHDVRFGLFCVHEVISYINDKMEMVDDMVVKKIFIDTYNRCLRYTMFKENQGVHEEWVFPPACMANNSYDYAIFWYEWIVEGQWCVKSNEVVGKDEEW